MNQGLIKALVDQACWRQIGVWGKDSTRCEKLESVRHCRNCEVFSEAAKRVFQRESSEVELFERSLDLFHTSGVSAHQGDVALLPFRMANTWFCVQPNEVVTVAKDTQVHSIPNRAEGFLLGLVPVEGAIYSCIDLASLFELETIEGSELPHGAGVFKRTLILHIGNKRLAIKVDEVRNFIYFEENAAKDPSVRCKTGLQPYVKREFVFDDFLGEVMFQLDLEPVGKQYYKALI